MLVPVHTPHMLAHNSCRLFALVVVLAVPLFALRTLCRERSSLSLRDFLSREVVGAYFHDRVTPAIKLCSAETLTLTLAAGVL